MDIQTRNTWRAVRTAPATFVLESERTDFVVHHSAGNSSQSVAAIQRFHIQDRKFTDIGYNFLVRGTTGEIYEGRGWNAVGAHTVGHNRTGLGVCVIGRDLLEEPAKRALRQLYYEATRHAGHTLMIRGHRDYAATVCPGPNIHKWIMSGGLELRTVRDLKLASPYLVGADVREVQRIVGADVDGIFGGETHRMVKAWQLSNGLRADGIVGPKTRAKMGLPT
jgi:peptidoglycan hydrolase-like protein with peptidoglycan-binding domain